MTLVESQREGESSRSPARPLYAEILVPRHLARSFTYLVPVELQGRLLTGSRVLVPFGVNRLHGVVVALGDRPAAGSTGKGLRAIYSLVDDTSETDPNLTQLTLSRMVAERYVAPWGQCLRLVIPPKPASQARGRIRYLLTDLGRRAIESAPQRSPLDRAILESLVSRAKGLPLSSILRNRPKAARDALRNLEKGGWVEVQQVQETHAPKDEMSSGSDDKRSYEKRPSPSGFPVPEGSWQSRLHAALSGRRCAEFLLEAPFDHRLATLLQTIEHTLAQQRTALLITGEIARALHVAECATARWGDRVVLMHSGLSPAAKAAAWRRSANGVTRVVVGTRSAVFAPMQDLGLVWVEGEEEAFLKEEQEPHYHARDIARYRAGQEKAVLVLGSLHPSLETLHEIDKNGEHLRLKTNSAGFPSVELIDLRWHERGSLLTSPMVAGIRTALDQRSGVALFLNRKAYARVLACHDCGNAPQCPRCSVKLAFYHRASRLVCQYCGGAVPLPETCPSCHAAKLEPVGFGTERLDEEIRRLFPAARIARLDKDTVRRPSQRETIRQLAWAGEIDILLGTQMLFHGAPLPPFGFVGIPSADAGLHAPDFRSAERTYHGLVDAVGLARTRDSGGRVMIQTYLPSHHAFEAVRTGNPEVFHKTECAIREALGYPPYSHLISLRVSGKEATRVEQAATRWAGLLKQEAGRLSPHDDDVTILGPVPSSVSLVRGRYRWQMLVKSAGRESARRVVQITLETMEAETKKGMAKFDVDVDPVEMG